ncbi:hypothetical protein [Streptomyces sp. NPDC026673]|uniref:hypothetical protein n=1 Tax=Streptomyces sp. NPDC026673 TaxID=3155724 RepID=UPI0033D48F93
MTAPSLHSTADIASLPAEVRDDLRAYAELGGFTVTTDTHAWYAAVDTVAGPEEARAASTALAELRGRDLPALSAAARSLAEAEALGIDAPRTVAESSLAVALLLRVRLTLRTLTPDTYDVADAELDELVAATASAAWRRERGVKVTWLRRRALRGRVRGLATGRPRRDAVHAALASAAAERTDWAALGGAGRPAVPADTDFLDEASRAAEAAVTGLGELSRLLRPESALDTLPFEELAELLERLAADEGTLYRLPNLRATRARLEEQGLGAVLAELTERRADAAEVVALLGEAETAAVPEPRTASEPEGEAVAEVVEPEAVAEAEAEAVAEEPVVEAAEEVPAAVPVAEAPVAEEAVSAEAVSAAPEAVAEEPAAEADEKASVAEVEPAPVVEVAVPVTEAEPAAEAVEATPVAEELSASEAEVVEPAPVVEAAPVAEAETVAEEVSAPEAEAVEAAAEVEPEPVVEAAVVEVEAPVAVAEPIVEAAPVVAEAEPAVEAVEATAIAEELSAPEAEVVEPAPVVEPEAVVEEPVEEAAEAEVVEAAPVVAVADPVVEAAPVAEEVSAPEAEALEAVAEVEPEPVVEADVAEVEAPVVVAEPAAEAAPVAEAEPVAEEPGGRPGKPSITPGKAVTAYSAEELTALVRWIDGDGEKRSDDELLRAAMKELGFARLGPRIKEALGAAVAEARA